MRNKNKGWKPWARDAGNLIFGWKSKPKREKSNNWADRKRKEVKDSYDLNRSLYPNKNTSHRSGRK